MDDYSFKCLSLFPLLTCSLTSCLTALVGFKVEIRPPKAHYVRRLEGKTVQKPDGPHAWSLKLVTLWSVNSEEIKGCRPCSYREEKGRGEAWALSGGNYKCPGVCRSCENTGTSSPVTAVPMRISEDCSHVRRRCTECVFDCVCVRGSRYFNIYSANN